jgi:hypothetical protein
MSNHKILKLAGVLLLSAVLLFSATAVAANTGNITTKHSVKEISNNVPSNPNRPVSRFDDIIWDMVEDESWATFEYREMVFDLSSYAGQTIQIAWRYVGIDGESFGLDDITVNADSSPILTEGFEAGVMPPTGWTVINTNPTRNWKIVDVVTYPTFVHTGSYAGWVNYDTPNPSDEWLTTPELDLSGHTSINLHFWAESDTTYPTATMELHILGSGGVDIIPPVTTCSLAGTLEGGVYISDVTVTLTATDDNSGVDYIKYKLDSGAWTTYSVPFAVSMDGSHTVYFYAVDNAGNIEAEKTSVFTIEQHARWIHYDSGPSEGLGLDYGGTFEFGMRLTPDELGEYDQWTLSVVEFYLFADGTYNGLMKIYAAGTAIEPGALLLSEPYSVNGEGWKEIALTTPLVVNGAADLWVTIEITHDAGVNPVGIDNGPAVQGKGDWVYFGGYGWVELYLVSGINQNFNLRAKVAEPDVTPPVTTCVLDGTLVGGVYISDVTVSLSAVDDISGVQYTMYKIDAGVYEPYSAPFMVTEDGDYTVYFYSVDNEGNQETEQSCTFTVEKDVTPPVTTCTLEGTMQGDVYISNVTVTLTATDDTSGVADTFYKLDGGSYAEYTAPLIVSDEGEHTVYFYSMDTMGNQETEKSSTFTIQREQPPALEITIAGGIGVSATIKNIGTADLTDVDWTIGLDGGLILIGKTKTGTIPSLAAGESVTVKDFVLGLGKTTITATAADAVKTAQGTVLVIFVIGVA